MLANRCGALDAIRTGRPTIDGLVEVDVEGAATFTEDRAAANDEKHLEQDRSRVVPKT